MQIAIPPAIQYFKLIFMRINAMGKHVEGWDCSGQGISSVKMLTGR